MSGADRRAGPPLAVRAPRSVRASAARTAAPLAAAAALAGGVALPIAAAEPAFTAPAPAPAPASATIEQPARAFGRMLGDVLVQRIPIDADTDVAAVSDVLPDGRIDAWLERLPVRLGAARRGSRALEVRYQIVNVPPEPRTIRLPPLSLALGGGTVEVPEWPIAVVPLTPLAPVGEGDLHALRPDRRLPPLDTGARRARSAATGYALAAVALAWLLWWSLRRRADRARLPFARALHAIRRVPAPVRDEAPEAWTALHRALDDTAGGTVHRGSLGRLFAAAPWLAPSREAIERFYAASAARFFSQPARAESFPVAELGRRLYRAERRNAR